MLKKEKRLIITFYTTTQAMAMEQVCKQCQAPGRIIPVPPSVQAGCGLAWSVPVEKKQELMMVMEENKLSYERMQECMI